MRYCVVIIVAIQIVGCHAQAPSGPSPADGGVPADLAAASNANGLFAIDLYRRLAETESEENIFLSPFSVSTALTMAAEGVRITMKDDDPSLYPDAQGHTMLSLDYQGHKIQMILLVPQSATGISDLKKSLSYETLERWIGQLEHRGVNLSIPKFKLESKYELQDTLQSLGMVRCFEIPKVDHQGAQFDKLTATERSEDRLRISAVVHQTYVDVSEVGTEAAAATALSEPTSDGSFETPKTRPLIPIFKANKPFVFLIRDRQTATILFLGRYVSPKP